MLCDYVCCSDCVEGLWECCCVAGVDKESMGF